MYCLCVNVYCITATGCQPKLFCYCVVLVVNRVVLYTVCVYMCTVLLPPGVNQLQLTIYICIFFKTRFYGMN